MRPFIKSIARKITSHSKLPLFFALPIELISAIQVLHVILASAFDSSLTNYFFFSAFAREITSYLGAVNLFDPLASESSITGVYYGLLGYFALHIILIVTLVIIYAKTSLEISWRVWEVISKLYILHSRLFFFPILYFFVGFIKVNIQCEENGYSGFYCQGAWEGLAILACLFNIFLALVQETVLYDLTKKQNAYAVKNNNFQLVVLGHKTVGIIVFFLIKELDYNDIFAGIIDTCFSILACYVFYTDLPYYGHLMIKTRVVLNGITLGCSIALLIVTFGVEAEYMEIIWTTLVMLMAKMALVVLGYISKSILQGRFKTPERAMYFVTLLKANNFGHFLHGVDRVNVPLGSILVNGALINQNIETSMIKAEKKSSKEYEDEVYSLLLEKFNGILYRNPKCVPLALYVTHIYMKRQGNILQSINVMKRMGNMSLSIAKENAVDEFYLALKKIYMEKYRDKEGNVSFLEYFNHRDIANEIKEEIQQETQMHLDFWMELRKEKDISCKKVFDLAYGVETLSNKLEVKFQQNIFGFSRTIANALLLSKMYLEKLREMPNEARKNMKKFIAIVHNPMARHPLDVYSNEKALLILSLRKDHIGEILDASGSIQSLFQMEKSKYMGLGLTTLFPEVFAREHTAFLTNYLKNSSTHKTKIKMRTYGKNKEGNFFELQAKFQLYPEIDQEVKVMALLQRVTSPIPVLLVAIDGTIVDCSESVKQNLYGSSNIVIGATKLQNLSMDYDMVNSAFNLIYAPKGDRQSLKSGTTNTSVGLGVKFSKFGHNNKFMSVAKTAFEDKYTTFTTESEKLDPEKAQKICESYMEGSKLTFSEFNQNNEMEYDVQIHPFVLEGGFYKAITIKNQEHFLIKQMPSKIISIDFERKISSQQATNVTQDQSLFAEEFPIAEEREGNNPLIKTRGFSIKSEMTGETPVNRPFMNVLSTNYAKHKTFDTSVNKRLTIPEDDRNGVKSLELMVKQERPPDSHTTDVIEQAKGKLSSSVNPVKTQEIKREMSVTSYATSGVYAIKSLKRIFTDASTFPLPRNTFWITSFLTVVMYVIGIVFFSYSRKTIDEHTDNTNIIDGVGQRLSYAVSSWQLVTRLYLSRLGLGDDDVNYVRENVSTEALLLLTTNNEVNDELSLILSEERLRDVFEADVLFWEPYENTTTTMNPINTFHATHILYDNLNEIVSQGVTSIDDIDVTDLIYAMNNTANDYFISSESLYSKTHDLLEELLDTNLFNLQIILVAISLVLAALGIILLGVSYVIIQSYRRLFRAMMKIEEYQVTFVIQQLKKFQGYLEVDIENNKFAVEDSGTFAETKIALKEHKKTNKKRTGFSNREDRFSVKILTIFLLKSIGFSLIFIVIPAALFFAALYDAIGDFNELDILDDQLSIAAKAQYQANLIMTVFYMEMMFRNDTTIMIKDQLPRYLLDDVVDEMTTLHEELSQSFFSQQDIIDDSQISQLLQENVCPLLLNPTESLMESCETATNGGELGLFSLNLGYITLSNTYIDTYLNDPTKDTADALVEPYSDAVREIMVTMQAAYDFLNDHLISIMDEKVEQFKVKQDVFFASILGSITLCFVIVYSFAIRKYWLVDMGRGKILKMIPYSIITDNRAIEFYLNKDFQAKKYNIGRKN